MNKASVIALATVFVIVVLFSVKVFLNDKKVISETPEVEMPVETLVVKTSEVKEEKAPQSPAEESPVKVSSDDVIKPESSGVQSPHYKNIKSSVAKMAFDKFLEEHGALGSLYSFISFDEFTISSVGPSINLFEATNPQGDMQMMIFVKEGSSPDMATVNNMTGIDPGTVKGLKAKDSQGEWHFLIETIQVKNFSITAVWKKYRDEHNYEQLDIFSNALRMRK